MWGQPEWGLFPWGEMLDGIAFGSGIINANSTYGSGMLVPSTLGSSPTFYLREVDSSYMGSVSFVVKTNITDDWNIYLEARHHVGAGTTSGYILYTASGSAANMYGIYKQRVILDAELTDIYSFDYPAYIWAQNTSGTYTTGKHALYFRELG